MIPFEPTGRLAPEPEMLRSFLQQNRSIILWKLDGVSREQGVEKTLGSETTLLGIVKHLAWVERYWFLDFIGGQSPEYPWSDEDPDADFRIETNETVESVKQDYVSAVDEANAVIDTATSLDVTGGSEKKERSLRWVLIHMIEETARHAGHLDIVRETLDGTTGYLPE